MRAPEKLFGIVLGGIALVVVLYLGGSTIASMFSGRNKQIVDLQKAIATKQARIEKARVPQQRLAEWERRSLPSDVEVAKNLYQNRLVQTIEGSGLSKPIVTPGSLQGIAGGKNVYERIGRTIKASGSLEQITKFLYEFYRADYLHQLTRVIIDPQPDKSLELTMTVEALSVTTADHKDKLNEGPSKRLALGEFAKYKEAIVNRNPFAPYVAPAPVARRNPPPPASVDPAQYTFLSAIMEVNGALELWLDDRMGGKTIKLHEGDTFEVGSVKGTVTRIGLRDVELSIASKPIVVRLGESLLEAVRRKSPPTAQTAGG